MPSFTSPIAPIKPNISMSTVHMVLLYSACRIEAAGVHLRELDTNFWPKHWHRNVWCDIRRFSDILLMSLSRQQTMALLPVCLNAFYNEGNDSTEVRVALQRFRDSDFRMINFVPTFVPGWERSRAPEFGSAWWTKDIPRYGEDNDLWLQNMIRDASAFFHGNWPVGRSPFPSYHNRSANKEQEDILNHIFEVQGTPNGEGTKEYEPSGNTHLEVNVDW